MNTKIKLLTIVGLFIGNFSFAQLMEKKNQYTHADTLRGSLNENRDWWDVMKYDIKITPDFYLKTIQGEVKIFFRVLKDGKTMQIDLQQPLLIDSIREGNKKLTFSRNENIALVNFNPLNYVHEFSVHHKDSITIYYHGKPREAVRPPWDGGWIWKKDAKGRPWMSIACQGLGASVWYPCKDYQGDEPDNGALITMIVPDTLMAVGNGRLVKKEKLPGRLINYTWEVKNPINTYNIVPYIGNYVNFTDTLMGEKGKLNLSYWVLDYNLDKAKEQFGQVKPMLRAFEYWFGPYPFYEDGYKLAEAPHLGMEHQGAIAYGNKYMNGYLGKDLSGTGWGLKWDFIIVHESGHEWFGNNITTKDLADMWVHEGFTNYSETLFTEYYYGKEAGTDYNTGTRKNIKNDTPIIGPYGVNKEGSGDMYYKGGNLLHSIRHSINNDSLFRQILRGLNKIFYHQTVTTKQIEDYISKKSGFNYSKIFDQYLRTTQIPILEYTVDSSKNAVTCRWINCVNGFDLPLSLFSNTQSLKLYPEQKWKTTKLKGDEIKLVNPSLIERLYYIRINQITGKPVN